MVVLGFNPMDSDCRLVSAEFSTMDTLLHSLRVIWDAFLPFAVLWWNLMLYATCAKYFSWRRLSFCSSSSMRALVSPGCPSLASENSVASKVSNRDAYSSSMPNTDISEDTEGLTAASSSSPFEDGASETLLKRAPDPCLFEDTASSSASFPFEDGEPEKIHLKAPIPCVFGDMTSSADPFACKFEDTRIVSSDCGSCPFSQASTALLSYLFEDSEASACTYPFIEVSPSAASTASRIIDNVTSSSTGKSSCRYDENKSSSGIYQFTNVSSSDPLRPCKYEAPSDKFPFEATVSLREAASTSSDKDQISQTDAIRANIAEELNIRYPCDDVEAETATVSSRMKSTTLVPCSSLPRNDARISVDVDYPFRSVDGFQPKDSVRSGISLMDLPLVELRDNMDDFPLAQLMENMVHMWKPSVSGQEFLISWLSPKTFEWIRSDLLGRISDAELVWMFQKFQTEAAKKDRGLLTNPCSFTKNFTGDINIEDNLNSFPRLGFRSEQYKNLDQELWLDSETSNHTNEDIDTKSVDQFSFASNISDDINPSTADSVEALDEEQHCLDPICSLDLNAGFLSGSFSSVRSISINNNEQDEYDSDCSSTTMDHSSLIFCTDVRDQNFGDDINSFLAGNNENTYENSDLFWDSDSAISVLDDDLYQGSDDVDKEESKFHDENGVMCGSEDCIDDNDDVGQQSETWWDEDAILLGKQEEDNLSNEWMLV